MVEQRTAGLTAPPLRLTGAVVTRVLAQLGALERTVAFDVLRRSPYHPDRVVRVHLASGVAYLRLHAPEHRPFADVQAIYAFTGYLREAGLPVPLLLQPPAPVQLGGHTWLAALQEGLHGTPLAAAGPVQQPALLMQVGRLLAFLHEVAVDYPMALPPAAAGWAEIQARAAAFQELIARSTAAGTAPDGLRALDGALAALYRRLAALWDQLPMGGCHGDPAPCNFLADADDLAGVIDFHLGGQGAFIDELAWAAVHFSVDAGRPVGAARMLLAGYLQERPLTGAEERALPLLLGVHSAMRFSEVHRLSEALRRGPQAADAFVQRLWRRLSESAAL